MLNKTLFLNFFGTGQKSKLLEYLALNRDFELSASDLQRGIKISHITLLNLWKELKQDKIILPTRTIGRSKLYKLNKEDQRVKQLLKLFDMILLYSPNKTTKKEKIPINT